MFLPHVSTCPHSYEAVVVTETDLGWVLNLRGPDTTFCLHQRLAGAPVWCGDLLLGPIKVSLLTSLLFAHHVFRNCMGPPIPVAHFLLSVL